jgi:hypothetical protein
MAAAGRGTARRFPGLPMLAARGCQDGPALHGLPSTRRHRGRPDEGGQ